jgi:hypothetical protein
MGFHDEGDRLIRHSPRPNVPRLGDGPEYRPLDDVRSGQAIEPRTTAIVVPAPSWSVLLCRMVTLSAADRLRTALGNSTTARQLAEMGLAGAGAAVLGEGFIGGDLDKGHYITAALALGAAYGHHRVGAIDKSLATQIGKMLASDDPAVLQRGIAAVAKSGKLMEALRAGGDAINALARRGTTTAPIPQVTPPIAQGLRPLYGAAAEESQPDNNQGVGPR